MNRWIPTRSATPSTALVRQRKVGFPIRNAGLLLGFQGKKTARRGGISSSFSDAGGCTSPQNSGAAKLEGLLNCAATRGLLQSYGRKAPRALSSCRYWSVVIDRTNSARSSNTFTNKLHEKSRLRRGQQERLAKAKTVRPRRNDILPRLELSDIWIDDLRPSPRKVRKLDAAHVREVASSISALGFCVLFLWVATTRSSMAKSATKPPSNWGSIGSLASHRTPEPGRTTRA
jgi:hypothetical protein